MSNPRVLIIGAGLGGMAFAQALRKSGISYQVFERDASPHARPQGWAIAVHWILNDLLESTPNDLPPVEECSVTAPLNLLSEAGIFDAYTGERKQRVGDRQPGEPGYMIRVNRAAFRDWLTLHLDIQWGKNFSRYEETDSGVTAFFQDGTTATGDILVGADGIHSHVRTQLLSGDPLVLNDLPLRSIVGETTLTQQEYEEQFKLARSLYVVHGIHSRLFVGLKKIASDKETAEYYWVLSARVPITNEEDPFWTTGHSKAEKYEYALGVLEKYHPSLTEVIQKTKPEGIMDEPLVFRDLVPRELPSGRITLLGDAIHAMAPFRGEGANHAMQDGLNLARTLHRQLSMEENGGQAAVPGILKIYEKEMLQRGTDAVLKSRSAADSDEDDPAAVADVWMR